MTRIKQLADVCHELDFVLDTDGERGLICPPYFQVTLGERDLLQRRELCWIDWNLVRLSMDRVNLLRFVGSQEETAVDGDFTREYVHFNDVFANDHSKIGLLGYDH